MTTQVAHDPTSSPTKAESKKKPQSKIQGIPHITLTSGRWTPLFGVTDTPTYPPNLGVPYSSASRASEATPKDDNGLHRVKPHRRKYKSLHFPQHNHLLTWLPRSLSTLHNNSLSAVHSSLYLPPNSLVLANRLVVQEKAKFAADKRRRIGSRKGISDIRRRPAQGIGGTALAGAGKHITALGRDTINHTITDAETSSAHRQQQPGVTQPKQQEQSQTKSESEAVSAGDEEKQTQVTSCTQENLQHRADLTQPQAQTRKMTDDTFLACFGPEDSMDTDTPTQSLKKILAARSKEKPSSKRPRDKNMHVAIAPKSTPETIHSADTSKNTHRSLWFGFDAMERLAEENGQEPLFYEETIADRVTRGIPRAEAAELEQVSISFPRIPQVLYPNKRTDGIPGQHYNLTHVPSEIPTDPSTCLSLDFQISIHFQLPNTPLLHNHVKELVKNRLETMNIPLGTNLIEPISILCMSVKRRGEKGVWAGIIKLHLLHPERDGIAMLKGLRPFILQLDPLPNLSTLGRVCKSYHAIARNNNLSIKITSDTLVGISPYALFVIY